MSLSFSLANHWSGFTLNGANSKRYPHLRLSPRDFEKLITFYCFCFYSWKSSHLFSVLYQGALVDMVIYTALAMALILQLWAPLCLPSTTLPLRIGNSDRLLQPYSSSIYFAILCSISLYFVFVLWPVPEFYISYRRSVPKLLKITLNTFLVLEWRQQRRAWSWIFVAAARCSTYCSCHRLSQKSVTEQSNHADCNFV